METAQAFQPFDWHRILLGDATGFLYLLEIAFRTTVMYLYALVFARFVGKRAVGQISPFEFILIIIISSAAGDPMFYHAVPLTHGILVITVVMLLHWAMSVVTNRSERGEDVLEGEPLLVVENGAIVASALGARTLSRRELMLQLRLQGIQDVGEVHKAFFEPGGKLSLFQASQDERKKTESTMPHDYKRQSGL